VFVEIVTDQSLASHRIGASSNASALIFFLSHHLFTRISSVFAGVTSSKLLTSISCNSWLGCTTSGQLPPVLVPAVTSASVASSTLPATVGLAFGVTVPVSTASHCPVDVL
jgi:hypothetical protein